MKDGMTLIKTSTLNSMEEEIARLKKIKEPTIRIRVSIYRGDVDVDSTEDVSVDYKLLRQIRRIASNFEGKISSKIKSYAKELSISLHDITSRRKLTHSMLEDCYIIPKVQLD